MEPDEDEKRGERNATILIVILSTLIAAISVYIILTVDLTDKPLAGQGSTIKDDVQIGGDFILTDQNGNEFNSDQMKGQISLVYFGFTYCPDICPTSLQKLSKVLATLDKYHIAVLPIFITIDPQRDTSALLKEYLSHFHPSFVGLSGSEEEVKKVADLYKVFYTKSESNEDDKNNYMVDHSSFVYLMDKRGKYVKHFYMDNTAEEIVEYIRINHSKSGN